ncbi:MAG: hypothetical protein WAN59_12475 [Candidatus Baltobacteraceae bacterium]
MSRLGRALLVAGVVLATCAARFPPAEPHTPATAAPFEPAMLLTRYAAPPLEPATVLARYADALAALKHPAAISFEFSVEQLGLRNLEQTHRVYRSGSDERDETLSVDGYALKNPAVRIFRNRGYRYDIATIAPKPEAYEFSFSSVQRAGDHYAYSFETKSRAAASFAVTGVTIDGASFLPSVVRFAASGGARASGRLRYVGAQGYWVVTEAIADARLPDGKVAHERIVWSSYRFPQSLPPSTFQAPALAEPSAAGDEP